MMVGGNRPCLTVSAVATASTPPAAPRRCPVMDLMALTARRRACSPKTRLIAWVSAASPFLVEVACALM